MAALILVLNAGSSTLKSSLISTDSEAPIASATTEWGSDRAATVRDTLASLAAERDIAAVAHRVVHGGSRFTEPVIIDGSAVAAIDALTDLAPLHNAPALDVIRAARAAMPATTHVACFDTAFHSTLTEAAWRYPVPREWHDEWGIRRFGFHGLSVEWSVREAAERLGMATRGVNLVVAHLGSGCSVTAVKKGRSVWTSMGFTPLEGLMMGTRSGSIDPGIAIHLLRTGRLTVDELDAGLERHSGLLAVSGRSSDMRELRNAARAGDERASLAIEMFVARAAEVIAAAFTWTEATTLVFTGGIGENDEATREAIVTRLPNTPAVLVVESREDLVMADAAAALLDPGIKRPRG
jgi:acetate kinase